jgi:acyl carrier protein
MTGANAALTQVDDVLAALRHSLRETSGFRPRGEVDADAPLQKGGLELDSVAMVELIAGIESRLGFEFLDSDLNGRSFASLRTLARVICNRLGNPRGEP